MTTVVATAEPTLTGPPFRAANFGDALRAEWTKARTVPSTMWTLVAAAVLGIGLGALISALASNQYAKGSASTRASWDPTSISGAGLGIAQLAIGVLGVLLISSEYSTGAIASSLASVPRRNRLLAAKAVVVLAVVFIVTEVIVFATFFIGQALISGHAPTAALGDPNVLRALVGSGLYGALIGVLGLMFATILRSAAAAISLLVALLFVLPGIAAALPASIEHTVQKFWPTQAGQQIGGVVRGAHTLAPWAGFGVFCAFVAIVSAAAFFELTRRDA
jgi:ABC-type transport system involved in multi-copper enzyme maturation permease subunit